MRYDNVTVKQTEDGIETLLPRDVCDDLGITKAIEKGPIVFPGHGAPTVTLRPKWGDAERAGFKEPQTTNR